MRLSGSEEAIPRCLMGKLMVDKRHDFKQTGCGILNTCCTLYKSHLHNSERATYQIPTNSREISLISH